MIVATFCAKCGSEIPTNQQSCGTCGAPAAASGAVYTPVQPAPFQPVASQPAAYQPVAAQPAAYQPPAAPPVAYPPAVPAKSGGGALKIILIIVAVIVGIGMLGAAVVGYGIWKVAHAIHVSGSGDNAHMTFNAPGGGTFSTSTAETFTAADLGTDIYPGATAGKGSMRMTLPNGSWVTAVFVTPDSKDQVVSFYKSKFGSEASIYDSAASAVITLQKAKKESIMVTVTANQSQYDGKTQVTILHTTSNKE
jgi:hypothetical protein